MYGAAHGLMDAIAAAEAGTLHSLQHTAAAGHFRWSARTLMESRRRFYMNMRHIKIFLAVCENDCNITKTAKQLYLA